MVESGMLDVEEAVRRIVDAVHPLAARRVALRDALGCILREDIAAGAMFPACDKSAMDGFALVAGETVAASRTEPVELSVHGVVPAGAVRDIPLRPGEACRIMTGAPLPPGADAVVEWEAVEEAGGHLLLRAPVPAGNHVIRAGEQVRQGEIVLRAGCRLRPVQLGTLAFLGVRDVAVSQTPHAAVFSTGDELCTASGPLEPGQGYDANQPLLEALLKEHGVRVDALGVVRDQRALVAAAICRAFETVDLVISSGGVSKGDYDFIPDALRDAGADILFHCVSIKPGKPALFAVKGKTLFFGLPGNPLSVATAFVHFVLPALERMCGARAQTSAFDVALDEPLVNRTSRLSCVYGVIEPRDGRLFFHRAGGQSSNHLFTLNRSNGMVWLPPACGRLEKGALVRGKWL